MIVPARVHGEKVRSLGMPLIMINAAGNPQVGRTTESETVGLRLCLEIDAVAEAQDFQIFGVKPCFVNLTVLVRDQAAQPAMVAVLVAFPVAFPTA